MQPDESHMTAIPMTRFTEELMMIYAPPRRQPATRRQMRQVLAEFEAAGAATTDDLRPVTICRWMDLHPDRTPVTTRSLLRCLSAACTYAVSVGYLDRSPFDFWKPAKYIRDDVMPRAPRPARHRSADDVRRVLDRADAEASGGNWEAGRLRALVYVYAYTGMRAAEALHLTRPDVDLFGRVLTICAKPGWRPKTVKSTARLPIAEPLAVVLAGWMPLAGSPWLFPGKKLRGPWVTGGPGMRPLDHVRALGERAGVPGLTIAGFRKTIGTLAKAWGFSQLELKSWLRHSNVETQKWYDEENVEVLRGTADKIRFRMTQGVAQ